MDLIILGKHTFSPYWQLILLINLLLVIIPNATYSNDHIIHQDASSYVLERLLTNDVTFLGTIHKRPAILKYIRDLIPHLKGAGITHIGLEIPTDQQSSLDKYMNTGTGLMDVYMHPQIDCPDYRDLLKTLYDLESGYRPSVIALDLPLPMYNQKISRNEWMARTIADIFSGNPEGKKMLVVAGNNHVLKKIVWEDHVPDKTGSIREYLNRLKPGLKTFSIGQLIDQDPSKCDFTKEFGPIQGSIALDCTQGFSRWKIGVTSAMAIKNNQPCKLVDGLIVY